MDSVDYKKNFRSVVEKIFNNWQNLQLAVENGMGGRNGQKVAMDIMNYTYEFCVNEDNITQGELQDVIEELMDQELNTICEDGSVPEICKHLLRYKEMSLLGQYSLIEQELSKLQGKEWLRSDVNVTIIDDNISSEDGSDSEDAMDVDSNQPSGSKRSEPTEADGYVEPETGWTTVRNRKR